MQIVVNATFLINIIKTDVRMLDKHSYSTIEGVLNEVEKELTINLSSFHISTMKPKHSLELSDQDMEHLSPTDVNLIRAASEKGSILVTDDRQLRKIAKEQGINCYTTPQFAAYLLKRNEMSKIECTSFLENLMKIYIRKKDVRKVQKYIQKW